MLERWTTRVGLGSKLRVRFGTAAPDSNLPTHFVEAVGGGLRNQGHEVAPINSSVGVSDCFVGVCGRNGIPRPYERAWLNMAWIVDAPTATTVRELVSYDVALVASPTFVATLRETTGFEARVAYPFGPTQNSQPAAGSSVVYVPHWFREGRQILLDAALGLGSGVRVLADEQCRQGSALRSGVVLEAEVHKRYASSIAVVLESPEESLAAGFPHPYFHFALSSGAFVVTRLSAAFRDIFPLLPACDTEREASWALRRAMNEPAWRRTVVEDCQRRIRALHGAGQTLPATLSHLRQHILGRKVSRGLSWVLERSPVNIPLRAGRPDSPRGEEILCPLVQVDNDTSPSVDVPHESLVHDLETQDRVYARFVAETEPQLLPVRPPVGPSLAAVVLDDGGAGLIATIEAACTQCDKVVLLRQDGGADGASAGVEVISTPGPPTIRDALSCTRPAHYFILLRPGDKLSNACRSLMACCLTESSGAPPGAVVVDQDQIDEAGRRLRPAFKPGFNPDFLIEYDYIGRGVFLNATALEEVKPPPADLGDDGLRDVLLRLVENGFTVAKCDGVCLHEVAHDGGLFFRKGNSRRFLEHVAVRTGEGEVIETSIGPRLSYRCGEQPLVSIIIPFRNRADLLRQCTESIFRISIYDNYEVLLVDNRSDDAETLALVRELANKDNVRVVPFDEEFNFSRLNNLAVREAKGDVLVFMNNDVKVLAEHWLDHLVGHVHRRGVGCVGAKLLFQDGSLQHAGVVVRLTGLAGHLFAKEHEAFLPPAWTRYVRGCTAVTAALLGIRRRVFEEVGGFDESFELTGQDVDLCIRVASRGYRNLWVPGITALHFEKQSRSHIRVRQVDVERSLQCYEPHLTNGDPLYPGLASLTKSDLRPIAPGEPPFVELLPKYTGRTSSPANRARSAKKKRPAKIEVAQYRSERGFLVSYDATPESLTENRAFMERFSLEREIEPRVVTWCVPFFDHVYRGGIYTILRLADYLSRRSGTHNRFVVVGGGRVDLRELLRNTRQAFPNIEAEYLHIQRINEAASLPESDIGICTLWTTAYALLHYTRCRGKFYFVQDYEPSFYVRGSTSGLIEQTYRFGFWGICNTPGVRDAYAAYGAPAEYFIPAVDRHVFRPNRDRSQSPIRIVFYGRPDKARNGFALGMEAFRVLKEEYGDAIDIVSVGADINASQYGLEGVVRFPGLLPNLEAVADLYHDSHIGLVFMFSAHPSYQPFEYMASGCATVTNLNEANDWLYEHGKNVLLAEPTLSSVVAALRSLIDNRNLREQIVMGGLRTVNRADWKREFDRIYDFITKGEVAG